MPRHPAAASTVSSRPESSAAATRSKARTGSGAASTPAAYARSTSFDTGTGAAAGALMSPSRLHSAMASGSPCVVANTAAADALSSGLPVSWDASEAVAARSSATHRQLGQPPCVQHGHGLVARRQDDAEGRAGEPVRGEHQRVE